MTASYTWPITLPQTPLAGSFSESVGFNYIRSPMDAGPAKIRKRSNQASPMSMAFIMNNTQLGYLKTFVETTISGVARFYFDHPRTGETMEVRIVPSSDGALYSIVQSAPDYYTVSISMERLP